MPLEGAGQSRLPAVQRCQLIAANSPTNVRGAHPLLSALEAIREAEGDVDRQVQPIIPIDYNSYRAVKNFNSRIRFIVIHYTAANFQRSVELLTGGQASAHYLIPDPSDPTYITSENRGVKIFNLVDEKERAWHAGVSSWRGRNNLNDTAIGIELVNQATDDGHGHFTFPPFHPQQIAAVKALTSSIIQRYPDVSPSNIVGHSDIAPGRKSDPGPAFPWKTLFNSGIGAWYDEKVKEKYLFLFRHQMPEQNDIIGKLKTYGYSTEGATTKEGFTALIRAFQLHFRPENYSGVADAETAAILYALAEKYGS